MKVLVIAPHPDDEVLGPGGTLLRYKSEGSKIGWLIITCPTSKLGWSKKKILQREDQIKKISKFFKFDNVFKLNFPAARLDTIPMSDLVQKISDVINSFQPSHILIPHIGDVHSDHQVVHIAVMSSSKWFRFPFIKKILAYEVLSETDFGLQASSVFIPNTFVDITSFLNQKIMAMNIYSSEIGKFPFPRSALSLESLARYRGSSSGFEAAEAFQLLRERC